MGVAGEETNPFAAWRSGPFPMPPGPDMYGATLSMAAAEKAGLHPYRAPTGVNSVAYDGRPACRQMGFCMQACAIGAKWSTLYTEIPRAEATGRCEVRPESTALKINHDDRGRVTGAVSYTHLTLPTN